MRRVPGRALWALAAVLVPATAAACGSGSSSNNGTGGGTGGGGSAATPVNSSTCKSVVNPSGQLLVTSDLPLNGSSSHQTTQMNQAIQMIFESKQLTNQEQRQHCSAGLVDPSAFAAKVAAVKKAAPGVFVNARVDTYWFHEDDSIEATLARASAYVEAGADGIFVPGLDEPDAIRAVTAGLAVPVNLLPQPERSLADLAALGVRRVSTGSLPYRASLAAAVAAAEAVRDGSPLPAAISYPEVQQLLMAYADPGLTGRTPRRRRAGS